MIAAYIHIESGETIYVQDFTAKVVAENMETLEGQKTVLFKKENDTTTYTTSKEVFEKEFTKK
jgi:hypothetical protein